MQVSTTSTITCPRCSVPVKGDFKYCPECAFRLRPGAPAPGEQHRPAGRGALLLLLAGVSLLAVGIWLGVEVFGTRKVSVQIWRPQRLKVSEIQDHLVPIPQGIATWEPESVWSIPPEDEIADRFMQTLADSGHDDFRDALLQETLLENPRPLTSWTRMLSLVYAHVEDLVEEKVKHVPVYTDEFQMMRYEITRGQWAEFLRSAQKNPGRLSGVRFVRDLWRPTRDGESNRELQYSRGYWDRWWRRVEQIHRARNEQLPKRDRAPELPRPAWLSPEAEGLTDEHGVLILIPPAWVRVATGGEITWWIAPPIEGHFTLDDDLEDLPVTGISWWDVRMFIEWARRELGIPNIDLPNGGEWLRAFHGGKASRPPDDFHEKGLEGNNWPWGNDPDPVGCNNLNWWALGDEDPRLRPVRKEYVNHGGATAEGVLNMAGNAAEWTDNWDPAWRTGRTDGPRYAQTRDENVEGEFLAHNSVMGGSYNKGIDDCKVDRSVALDKRAREIDVGFRLIFKKTGIGR